MIWKPYEVVYINDETNITLHGGRSTHFTLRGARFRARSMEKEIARDTPYFIRSVIIDRRK